MDVHRDFCEVAIVEAGEVRSAGRIETTPETLELFAGSVCATDRVALEVTGNAWEIARILEPHVGRVLVVDPGDTGIRQASGRSRSPLIDPIDHQVAGPNAEHPDKRGRPRNDRNHTTPQPLAPRLDEGPGSDKQKHAPFATGLTVTRNSGRPLCLRR